MVKKMILIDTNVVIEFFKGNAATQKKLTEIGFDNLAISSVTEMELYFGALNKKELSFIKKHLRSIFTIHIDTEISIKAVTLIEKYSKSHNLQIPDAIIAATAIISNIHIFTYNLKDFKYIDGLSLIE